MWCKYRNAAQKKCIVLADIAFGFKKEKGDETNMPWRQIERRDQGCRENGHGRLRSVLLTRVFHDVVYTETDGLRWKIVAARQPISHVATLEIRRPARYHGV
jgi:hypothetical protein